MSCSAEVEANRLLEELTKGDDFTLPDIDMSGPEWDIPGGDNSPIFDAITKVTNESLTTREVGGSGTFDALMESAHNHLKAEFKANRITGGEYTKAYIAMMESCMSNAVQFLLGRDQAYWAAAMAQIQAVTARVQLATSKAQFVLAKIQALSAKSEYALTKMKIATESETYCAALFNADQMLPQQLKLITEQTEAQRAQTLDTRSDGATVTGSVGKQKELYSQQITSYQRDAEVKASKLFTDAWITQKTIDEGLNPPNGFTNASIDTILTKLKSNNGLN
ncbi:virion structural protein [Escherichia phage vB_EcoP_PhAPEC7]|uniref:Putative structural protein n=1 Tax=Escherichia phage vB_EcoP_PhAPEC7 TaxID=1391223 RepID=A0A067ZJ52_9CAUD|nr:virion structural protein [Escherichia phage vB_EcoP_PhAPEC7]AHV82684.1 putative structural protein [Escherichia phage vB_EcoP_PhAPEC7]